MDYYYELRDENGKIFLNETGEITCDIKKIIRICKERKCKLTDLIEHWLETTTEEEIRNIIASFDM